MGLKRRERGMEKADTKRKTKREKVELCSATLEKFTIAELKKQLQERTAPFPSGRAKKADFIESLRPLLEHEEEKREIERLKSLALSSPFGTTWDSKQARYILGTLLTTPMEQWESEYARERVMLLGSLGVNLAKINDSELHSFVMRTLPKYVCPQAKPLCPHRSAEEKDIRVSDLHDTIKPLLEIEWNKWTPCDVEPIIALLAGRSSVLAAGSPREAVSAYLRFTVAWDSYLTTHPDAKAKMDPYIVIAEVGGAVLPAGFVAAVGNYPAYPNAGAGMGPLNATNYAWNFGGGPIEEVSHFIGYMQGAVPGTHFWMINANNAPTFF